MADPVKAGAKRWAPGGESEKPRKKSRQEKEERRKKRAGETPAK